MIDLSLGGLRAESARALSVGADYVLEVAAAGASISITAEVVRCHLKTLQPKPVFDVGFSFLNADSPATRRAVDALLAALASASQPLTA